MACPPVWLGVVCGGLGWVGSLRNRELGPIICWDSPSTQCQAGPEVVAVPRREPLDPARHSGISSHVHPSTTPDNSRCHAFVFFFAVNTNQEPIPYHRSSTSANAQTNPRPGHALNTALPCAIINANYSTPPVPDSSIPPAAPPSLLAIAVMATTA